MQESVNFYTQILGMRILRTLKQPTEKYTLVFLGYDDESQTCALELTYNYGISNYELGDAFGHIAISVDNCRDTCNEIKGKGGTIVLEPKPLTGSNEIIAFVIDPDGYKIELIQRITNYADNNPLGIERSHI